MYSPILTIPAPRASGWFAETDPKYARVWLDALPLADSPEAAREIYQALYTVNRLELRVSTRLKLMALYDEAMVSVSIGLQPHLANAVPPFGPKKQRLAEFARRLHIEMAYGYKRCLRDLSRAHLSLRRKMRSAFCIERALYHLSEVLLRSYIVYLPYPTGVWREMHELYRLADDLGVVDDAIDANAQGGLRAVTIGERYVQAVLLGLANPYQLPQNAVQQVQMFLGQWGAQARIGPHAVEASDVTACFLADLTADAPAIPLAQDSLLDVHRRVLDARALLASIYDFIARIDRGEQVEQLALGIDCLDSACIDLLKRMARAWGETARRRYTRHQRSANVFLCLGLNALHFFLSGQRPFATYVQARRDHQSVQVLEDADTAFVDLDAPDTGTPEDTIPNTVPKVAAAEHYRVDRWRLRDIGPQGMAVGRYGDAATPTRVGDLVGVQQPSDFGRWRPAVIRWVKTPEASSIEAGVEMLAADVMPVALRFARKPMSDANPFPALRLPATEVGQRPSTLLLPRGLCQVGDELELLEEEAEPRRIRLLRLLERTGSFEQIVYGEIVMRVLRRR